MCNWRAWLLPGFLTLIVLTALAVILRGGPMEADLTARSMAMMEQGGTPWTSVTADGRDVMLTGIAPTEAARAAAIQAAERVVGIYRVDASGLGLLPLADPYVLTLEKAPDSVTVTGSFPNGETRAALLDELRDALGSPALTDNSQLARGAPADFTVWASFAAASLDALESGVVTLDDNRLSLTGEAFSLEAYDTELARLAVPPNGLTLGNIALNPPAISPYTWSALATASGVTLSGHIPDTQTRERIVSAASQLGSVTDQMEIGLGAPEGFATAANALLDQMSELENGTASINDRELSLTGDASTSEAYRLANAFLGSLPAGFDSLSGRIAPPLADPFVTTLEKIEEGYALTGVLPDETSRAVLLDALEGQGGSIADTATVARGAPQAIAIGDLFAQIASILDDLEEGSATLTGDSLAIVGTATDSTLAQEVEARIAALASNALSVGSDITVGETEPLTVPR